MVRVVIAGANIYNPNKGVDALATSSIILLYQILSKNTEAFEICLYNREYQNEWDSILFPDGSSIRFKNIYPTDIFSVSGFIKTLFSKQKLYYLKEFLRCDFVFNISAGDGFSDIYGKGVFLLLSRVNRLCRLFHKPYILLPQTFGPFFSPSTLELAKKECRSAKLLMSRDKESTELLIKDIGCTKVLDVIDVAFILPYRKLKTDSSFTHIGINISETLCSDHNGHQFHVNPDYLLIMKEVILDLLSEGMMVHLIPHVADTNSSPKNEYYIQYRLWEEIQHPGLVPPPLFLSAIDAKSYISSMDLFIGSRMHACIAAFSSNVPVLLLGYSRKFSGLFSGTLDYPYLLDIADDFSKESVLKLVREMLHNLPLIKKTIQDKNRDIVMPRLDSLCRSLKVILNG